MRSTKVRIRLNASFSALLREVAAKHHIDLTGSVTGLSGEWIFSNEERRAIIDAISDEFSETGLREDDEPNPRGHQLEALLDEVNRPWLLGPS